MIIARIDGATRYLGLPRDWDKEADGDCGSLAIRDEQYHGQNVMVSAWTPTPGELAALQAGAHVYLHVFGEGHPPVMLLVGNPP